MNIKTIKLFLERNPIDDDFSYHVTDKKEKNSWYNFSTLDIQGPNYFDFSIDIDLIKSIGLSSEYIFIETDFGRYSFLKKSVKSNQRR